MQEEGNDLRPTVERGWRYCDGNATTSLRGVQRSEAAKVNRKSSKNRNRSRRAVRDLRRIHAPASSTGPDWNPRAHRYRKLLNQYQQQKILQLRTPFFTGPVTSWHPWRREALRRRSQPDGCGSLHSPQPTAGYQPTDRSAPNPYRSHRYRCLA